MNEIMHFQSSHRPTTKERFTVRMWNKAERKTIKFWAQLVQTESFYDCNWLSINKKVRVKRGRAQSMWCCARKMQVFFFYWPWLCRRGDKPTNDSKRFHLAKWFCLFLAKRSNAPNDKNQHLLICVLKSFHSLCEKEKKNAQVVHLIVGARGNRSSIKCVTFTQRSERVCNEIQPYLHQSALSSLSDHKS